MQTMSKILILIFAAALLFFNPARSISPCYRHQLRRIFSTLFVEWLSAKLNGRRLTAVCLAYLFRDSPPLFLFSALLILSPDRLQKALSRKLFPSLQKYYEEYSDFLPEIFNFSANSPNTAAFLQNLGNGAADF